MIGVSAPKTRRQIQAEKRRLAAEREAEKRNKNPSKTTTSNKHADDDRKVKVHVTVDFASAEQKFSRKAKSVAVVAESHDEKQARRREQAEKRRLAAMKAGQDSKETTGDSKRLRSETKCFHSLSSTSRDDYGNLFKANGMMDPYDKVVLELAELKEQMETMERTKDSELAALKHHMNEIESRLASSEKALTRMNRPPEKEKFRGVYKASIRFRGKNREIGGFATEQQASLAYTIASNYLYPSTDNIGSKEADEMFEEAKKAAWEGVCKQFK